MKKFRELSEAVKDKFDIGEYDQEGDMAKSDLRSILANAKRVHDMLEDSDNLPEWVQSKITKAEDYMSTVANYMEAEMNEEVEQIDELKVSTLTRYGTKAMQAYGRNPEKDEKRQQGIQRARAKVQQKTMKKEETEIDESIASTVGGLVGQYAGSKIGMEGPGKEHGALAGRMIDYHARKLFKKFKNVVTGQKNESVELDEGKYGAFRVGPKSPRYPYVPQGDRDPRTGLPLGFSNHPIDKKPEEPKKMKKEEVESLEEKNVPTSPEKWAQAKAQAKAKFDVYPSAYANGWASKKYKEMGGGWKSVNEEKKDDPPFTPDPPRKKSVVVGKKPQGYSMARQLARQGMKKYLKPVKEEKDMSKKAQIVKSIMKKDKFEANPVISKTVDDKQS